MGLDDLAEHIDRYIDEHGHDGQGVIPEIPGIMVVRHPRPTTFEAVIYNPVVCLILRGSKETTIGNRTVRFGRGQSLVVSHDLPVVSRVTDASPKSPYLAMIVVLDLGIVRSLYEQVDEAELHEKRARSLDVYDTDASLIDALGRYFGLTERPLEASVVGPLVFREIHFRLLIAPNGGMLRRLLKRDSHASRIEKAIAHIRMEYRSPLAVADLAEAVGMSASSFYDHFKSVTATTPLQYQKDLRLIEARRLLSEGVHSVSTVAFEVGYESPNQFSREYARKFGASPRNDIGRAVLAV